MTSQCLHGDQLLEISSRYFTAVGRGISLILCVEPLFRYACGPKFWSEPTFDLTAHLCRLVGSGSSFSLNSILGLL